MQEYNPLIGPDFSINPDTGPPFITPWIILMKNGSMSPDFSKYGVKRPAHRKLLTVSRVDVENFWIGLYYPGKNKYNS